jgi:hypothetical protein
MSDEARFMQAMAAATPPARDAAFIVAVLERAEAARFRAHNARALLRGAGVAAGLAGLLVALLSVASAEALVEGLLASAGLAMFVISVRRATAVA